VEIHPPHRAIGSLKEALVHLTLITVGVLIALSFEGIASWREQRALVREARANLASEIRDNMNELSNRLKNVPNERRNIDRAYEVLAALTAHRPLEGQFELNIVTADLRDASHATAQLTGAFALMEYDEVKKFASVYGHQAMYVRLHNDAFQNLSRTLALGDMVARNQLPSDRELDEFRQQPRWLSASLTVEEQIGGALLEDYKRALQGAAGR
jgi:hypothetical protein